MKIHQQSVFEKWPMEDKSIQAIITSPPYFNLRKYVIPDVIIGGDENCKHEWGITFVKKGVDASKVGGFQGQSFRKNPEQATANSPINEYKNCILCGAWQGQYGLEPSIQLYVEHTLLWCKEAWRVLRNDGVFFLNIADSYGSGNVGRMDANRLGGLPEGFRVDLNISTKPKSQCLIPERVSLGLVEAGWIRRNHIVWYKPNAMPESCQDRFSKKWESVFMFTKTGDYYFDLDGVRESFGDWAKTDKRFGKGRKSYNGKMKTSPFGQSGSASYLDPNPKGKNPGDIWGIPTRPSSEKHYAMWPETLVERMLKCSTKAGDIILDPFCGSGTTLKVAERWDRIGTGIDLGYGEIQNRKLKAIQKEMIV